MTTVEHIPYDPQSLAERFTVLTSEGLDGQIAFNALVAVLANMPYKINELAELVRAFDEYRYGEGSD